MSEMDKNAVEGLYEATLESESIFEGKVLSVRRDKVKLIDGSTAMREVVGHNGAVCIVALKDNGNVILEYQYRYAVGERTLEIPAGKLDSPDEDPQSAARRELREETGAVAGKLTYLGQYLGAPAILGERVYMYLAEELSFSCCDYDEGEFMVLTEMPLCEAAKLAMEGKLTDGKTQAAILRVYLLKQKEFEK